MKKKLLYINNFEAPYRVPFFNYLGNKYDLTLALSEKQSDRKERNAKWFAEHDRNYKVIHLKTSKIFGVNISFEIKKYLASYDIVFLDMYANPTNIYSILLLNRMKKKFILSVDGMLPKFDESKMLYFLKKYLLNSPAAILSPGNSVDNCIIHYGVDKSKIYRYHFTSLLEHDLLYKNVSNEAKVNMKLKLGIKEKKAIISVGRFTYNNGYGKGYDKLMQISSKLNHDIGIYIIGDEPTKEFVEWKQKDHLDNVHFVGFQNKKELANYYIAADIFALLTQGDVWGLVINEAMSFGLPIVTTNKCVAGLELVKNGFDGYIVPSDTWEEAYKAIDMLLSNEELLTQCSVNSLNVIKDYTVENMAQEHINVFEKYFSESI